MTLQSSVLIRAMAVVTCAVPLASCEALRPLTTERRVEFAEEVANVYVSAYPAVPWSSIGERLQPQHNLTTADARSLAAVTTQAQVSQFLSTFSAGLGIGLPSRTRSSTTEVAADGSTSTTGSRQLSPGAVPASSGAAPSAIGDAALAADLSKTPLAMGLDASTQLMAGTAVYQLAKILDNQISLMVTPKGYEAHLLTLQVNVQPLGRNLPYDAYINVTMLPAAWARAVTTSKEVATSADGLAPVVIYPLVITDAMETSSVGRSLEVVRQAALQLSGIVANAGINLGLGGGTDRLESILGSDRNSIMTVGRVSDHTIRVRLGAQAQGSRALALVPRTHNISLVVFTRAGTSSEDYVERLALITEATFVDVDSGQELDSRRSTARDALAKRVQAALTAYGYELNSSCTTSQAVDLPLDLLRAVDRSDFPYLSRCLVAKVDGAPVLVQTVAARDPASKSTLLDQAVGRTAAAAFIPKQSAPDPNALEPATEARLRRLLARLMSIQVDSRFSKLLVQLTPMPEPEAPPKEQLAILTDDLKAASTVVLREGKKMKAAHLRARLKFKQANRDIVMYATAVTVDAAGNLTLTFPSIVANKLQTTIVGKDKSKPPDLQDPDPITLTVLHEPAVSKFTVPMDYRVKYSKAEAEAAANPVSVLSTTVVADAAGQARVSLLVGAWDATKLGALGLRISGGDLRSSEPAVAIDMERKALPLSAKTAIVLNLANLTPAQAIQLRTIAGRDPVGSPIVLAVEPPRATAR